MIFFAGSIDLLKDIVGQLGQKRSIEHAKKGAKSISAEILNRFLDVLALTRSSIPVMDISNSPVLIKMEASPSNGFSAYTWTSFKNHEKMTIGVMFESCNTGGVDFKIGLLGHVKDNS